MSNFQFSSSFSSPSILPAPKLPEPINFVTRDPSVFECNQRTKTNGVICDLAISCRTRAPKYCVEYIPL